MQSTFFISSSSPGAVFRFLERLARHENGAPDKLILSDPVGALRWRLLRPGDSDWLLSKAPQLVVAFPPELIWLDCQSGDWRIWNADGSEIIGQAPPLPRRLLLPSKSGAEGWARAQGLPLERLTKPPRVLDYETVAQLDQKSLLLEDTPRLYRFPLGGVQ